MQGQIESASKSKSGKVVNVKIGGQFYITKNWEFQNMVGQSITFDPSPSKDGQTTWINEYGVVGQSGTASAQVFDQAHAQNQPPPMGQPAPPVQVGPNATGADVMTSAPQPSVVNREASIIAQALTKAVTCANAGEAWECYVYLYYKVLEWNPGKFDDDPRY